MQGARLPRLGHRHAQIWSGSVVCPADCHDDTRPGEPKKLTRAAQAVCPAGRQPVGDTSHTAVVPIRTDAAYVAACGRRRHLRGWHHCSGVGCIQAQDATVFCQCRRRVSSSAAPGAGPCFMSSVNSGGTTPIHCNAGSHTNCRENSFAATTTTSSCTASLVLSTRSARAEPPLQLAVALSILPRNGSELQRR